LASSLAVGAFAGVEAIFGLWTQKRFGWGPREIGLCFAGIGVVGALLQGLAAGPLARRFGEGRVLVAGLSLILVALFFQSLNLPWPLAIVAMMIVATGQSLSFPAVAAMISRAASPSRQGEMLGLNLSGGALARITGPMAAGAAFTILGPSAPFLAGAILMAPALLAARSASRALGKSKS
jgi:MFS family permease